MHTQVIAELRRKHRIRAQLTGRLPPLPETFNGHVTVATDAAGDLMIETPGELSGLLGWLATLPLAEVNIEPVGLRALYDQYHAALNRGSCEHRSQSEHEPGAVEKNDLRIALAAVGQHGVHVRRALAAGLDQQLLLDRAPWRACSASCPSWSSS